MTVCSFVDKIVFHGSFQCCWFDHFFEIFLMKKYDTDGGWSWLANSFFTKCFWSGIRGWVKSYDVLKLLSRQQFAVDNFLLCKFV